MTLFEGLGECVVILLNAIYCDILTLFEGNIL